MSGADLDLDRFVKAQEPMFDAVCQELRDGRKRTHWMWFVFPQLRALGRSATAHFYGIASLDEARAYHAHALLGPRLTLCTGLVLASDAVSLNAIFGFPDDMKFRSCMTLFEAAVGAPEPAFGQALERWCGGERDPLTLRLLAAPS